MTDPPWAETRYVDDGFIEFSRPLGTARTSEGTSTHVDLVQTMTENESTPVHIRLDGHRYDAEQAAAIIDALVTGLRLMR